RGAFCIRVTPRPLAMQPAAQSTLEHDFDEGADWRRHRPEELGRPAFEIAAFDEAGMDYKPIEMVLAHFLGRPGNAAFLRSKVAVEVDIIALLDMKADHRGIGNDRILVPHIGQLAFWRLAEPGCVRAIGKGRYPQQHRGLGHEWAWIGEAPEGTE